MIIFIIALTTIFAGGFGLVSMDCEDYGALLVGSSALLGVTVGVAAFHSYLNHADDLGVLMAQKHKIAVYENQKKSLEKVLADFNYPKNTQESLATLNSDSPIASVVAALSKVTEDLAEQQEVEAQALVRIAQRKRGPFKFIVTLVGEK